MHLFKNNGYAASVPSFTKALELFPGHFLASRNLAIAKQRAGSGVGASGMGADGMGVGGSTQGAPTAAGATSGGTSWLVAGRILLAVALLAAGAVLIFLRRRQTLVAGRRSGRARTAHLRGPTAASRWPRRPLTWTMEDLGVAPEDPVLAQRGSRTGRREVAASSGPDGPPPPPGAGAGACAAAAGTLGAAAGAAPAFRADRPTGPHRSPSGRDGSRATCGTGRAPAPAPRGAPNASSAAPSVAPPRPTGADAAGAAGRPAAPGQAPAPGSAPAPRDAGQASRSAQESAPRFCTTCGGRLSARHQFCGWCGEPVG